jgi:chorismate dehydratase
VGRLRIATVPYVNAAPLVWGFRRGALRDQVEMVAEPPSRIPDLLREGQVDAGLIPVIETQRLEGLTIHPALCIASLRRARSVLLVSRRPIEEARRIALDSSSRSSAALLRVLLEARGLRGVIFAEQAPSLAAMLESSDAALLIGDPALAADTTGLEVLDLAAEWFALTGLPFVFAVWAVRRGAALPADTDLFEASYREGLGRIDDIAAEVAQRAGLHPALVADYLRVNIHYRPGPEEWRAIDLFFGRAHEIGLIDAPHPLAFLPVGTGEGAGVDGAVRPERETPREHGRVVL